MTSTYHLDYNYFQHPLNFENISIRQIGRMYCEKNGVIEEHIHTDLYELTIVTEGEGLIYSNKIPTKVSRGDIYLSLPCDAHEIISDGEKPLKYDFIAFLPIDGEIKTELEKIAEDFHSPNNRVFHDERIRQITGNAIAEIKEDKIYSHELLSSLFKQMIIYLIRGFQNIKPDRQVDTVTDAEVLCYKLMNYIDTHIYSMKSLEELSYITDYSYGYLSTLFKKTTSNTLSHYYREKKLDAARLLILENRLKITEISDMLGYASVYAFSKAFSNKFGLSPRIYRTNFGK